MKRKELDRMIARFALERGHTQEMACKMLLSKYVKDNKLLTEVVIEAMKHISKDLQDLSNRLNGPTVPNTIYYRARAMLLEEQLGKLRCALKQAEEKSWADIEKTWAEGFESGVNDFEEMERRKDILRKKGFLVVGDKPKKNPKVRT